MINHRHKANASEKVPRNEDWEGLCDVGITSKESIWRRGIKRVCERDDDRWFDDMV